MTCNLTIHFTNDQTIYCPGQDLLGHVTVEITEKSQFSGLRLTITGSAMCKFRDSPNDVLFTKETSFTGHERYLCDTIYLFGSSRADLQNFKPGSFNFKFEYRLPVSLPTSVKAKHGKIRYQVEANLQTGWEFDVYSKTSFTVINFEDLSRRVDLMDLVADETKTSFCCWSCKTKPLIVRASIPFSGYVPKQKIIVTIKIDNRSGFDVYRTITKMKKIFTFISETPEKRDWSESKTLVKMASGGAKNGCEAKICSIIEVPDLVLPTNLASNVVKVSYLLVITSEVVGFVRSPKVKLPIVIGTRPLKFENKKF